jgi:Fuc2NAc and GlcNAc transferase
MMKANIYLIVAASFALGFLAAAFIYKFGGRIGLMDMPVVRSSHSTPTPSGGGVGIPLAFALLAFFFLADYGLAMIGAAMGLLGFMVDLTDFSPKGRLLLEFIIASAALAILRGLPISGADGALFLSLSVFIVATANIYNFMDGINGIAALSGIMAFGTITVFSAIISNDTQAASISLVIAAACASLLPFNFPKARVFMGDTASLFLGFIFAYMVIRLSSDLYRFVCLVTPLSMFYADTAVTIFHRWRNKETLLVAHRRHLYQYLCNELRLSQWVVALGYAFIQGAIGLISLYLYAKKCYSYVIILFAAFWVTFIIFYKIVKSRKAQA